MKRFRNVLVATVAALGILTITMPVVASAATGPQGGTVTRHYTTSMSDLYGMTAPYTGSLDLTVAPDGTFHGFYFPDDQPAAFITVVGAQSNGSIWLDIGDNGQIHVTGQIKDGKIVGSAIDSSQHPPLTAQAMQTANFYGAHLSAFDSNTGIYAFTGTLAEHGAR